MDGYSRTLGGNPLECDCRMRWFPAFRESINALSNIGTCSTPEELSGIGLQGLTEDQFVCGI